jgi:hypothetical protein
MKIIADRTRCAGIEDLRYRELPWRARAATGMHELTIYQYRPGMAYNARSTLAVKVLFNGWPEN